MKQVPPEKDLMNRSIQKKIAEKIAVLKEIEQDIPSVMIVHNMKDASVLYMSAKGLKILGVTMEELIAMGPEYHERFFNLDFAEIYVPKIFGLMERNSDDEVISFFQQVRRSAREEWTWYLSCTKIFMRDDENKPLLIITNAVPMDATHYIEAAKAQRLLEENTFLYQNKHIFRELTKREKEILTMMAKGLSSGQMAKKLHISEMTVTTHRRNIKKKLKAKNNYDITRFAQAFDLI